MDEKVLRESFEKIKEDMLFLSREILDLKEELNQVTETADVVDVPPESEKEVPIAPESAEPVEEPILEE